MFTRASAVTAFAVMLGITAPTPADAEGPNRSTVYLTFRSPVALPGVVLQKGTYVFQRAEIAGTLDIVEVSSRHDLSVHVFLRTNLTRRPEGWPANKAVSVEEAAAGAVPRVLAWYPPGDDIGHQFVYPKDR